MALTSAQQAKVRLVSVAKFRGLTPERQVSGLATWLMHDSHASPAVWKLDGDDTVRALIDAIASQLLLSTHHPEFKRALAKVTAPKAAQHPKAKNYSRAQGSLGVVPADVVRSVCLTYQMERDVIVDALSKVARPFGDNGIKKLVVGRKNDYEAELKLMAMGDDRIYAKSKEGSLYLFDTVGKGKH